MLFTNLPARCIVLLEDIDTAGLIRELSKKTKEKPVGKVGRERGNNDRNAVDLAKSKGYFVDGMLSPFLPQLSFSLPSHSPPSVFFQRSRD